MPARFDWMWFAGAALLAALGLWLLYRALLHDRARGRRRCPKCWYQIAVEGLTCSECGHVAQRERSLRKIRRRWRRAALSACMLLVAFGAAATPHVMRSGWHTFAPTTLLIMMMPGLQSAHPDAFAELCTRCDSGSLREWQWRWLLGRCFEDPDKELGVSIQITPSNIPTRPVSVVLDFSPSASLSSSPLFSASWRANFAIAERDIADSRLLYQLPGAHRELALFGPCGAQPMLKALVVNGGRVFEADVVVHSGADTAAIDAIRRLRLKGPLVQGGEVFRLHAVRDMVLTEMLRSHVWFELGDGGLELTQDFDRVKAPDVACAVRIELLRNGHVVGCCREWWGIEPPHQGRRWARLDLPLNARDFSDDDLRQSEWRIRVSGDADLARWATQSCDYWAGEFETPLMPLVVPHIGERSETLVLRSIPAE